METHQVAIVLGNGSRQIVVPKFTGDSAEGVKGVNVAAHESFEALAVSELHIQLAAMTFHETEGIELACVALVGKDTEMAPVDFEALAGCGLHAHIGPLRLSFRTHAVQVFFQDAQTTVEAKWAEPLCDHHGAGFRILLQQFRDCGFKRIQFAGTLPRGGCARRRGQVPGDGSTSQVEMTRDLAYRPVLGEVQAMNGVDLFGAEHIR